MSHANLPAIDGRMAECRSEEGATDASQGSSPPRGMPQLSPILEVEQDSQRTSSVISDTPPTLQPVTISPYTRVAIDTQTHNAQAVNIAHPQCAITQPTISTPAANAQHTTPQTTTNTRPLSTILLVLTENPTSNPDRIREVKRDCSILRRDEAVLERTPTTEVLTRTEQTHETYLPIVSCHSQSILAIYP